MNPQSYLVRGYTKTGIYAVNVLADNPKQALSRGKAAIANLNPLSRVLKYAVDDYSRDAFLAALTIHLQDNKSNLL